MGDLSEHQTKKARQLRMPHPTNSKIDTKPNSPSENPIPVSTFIGLSQLLDFELPHSSRMRIHHVFY
jgi:hypothetical protein